MIFELLHPIMYLQPCFFHFHLGDANALAVHGVSPALGRAVFFNEIVWVCQWSGYPLVNYQNYGKSPFSMGKSTINHHFQ
jgi:hypothetical protein